jgi:hypothetical protein
MLFFFFFSYKANVFIQFFWLFWRNILTEIRDPFALRINVIQSIVSIQNLENLWYLTRIRGLTVIDLTTLKFNYGFPRKYRNSSYHGLLLVAHLGHPAD